MKKTDLVRQMQTSAEAVQAVVRHVADPQEAFQYALTLTRGQNGRAMAAVGFENALVETWRRQSTAEGVALVASALRERAGRIHTALTPADWGIADTGTLVIDSAGEDIRLATMLAEIHVALLPVAKIHADTQSLADLMDGMLKSKNPSYLAFITGASRTADIERVLAIGVHGPRELHILLMHGP